MTGEELWIKFCRENNVDADEPHDCWGFGDGGEMADELLRLVLEGKKFGTAGIYEDYQAEDEELPGDRAYSVLLDSKDEAVCVIRNFEVKVEPFERVSEYHGFAEGEEERNLAAWRRIHSEYWQEDFERLHIASPRDCHVVQEKFTVEYVLPGYDHDPEILDDIFLIEPNIRYADQIREYREEMLAAGSSMDGCLALRRIADPGEWVEHSYEWGNPLRVLEENGIRGTLLMMIRKSDDRLVGMAQVRVIPETHPMHYAGHIGYSIRPSERRKGYAKKLLGRCLTYLRFGRMVDVAELSVLPDNVASRRTILANGGVFAGTFYSEKYEEKVDLYKIDIRDRE